MRILILVRSLRAALPSNADRHLRMSENPHKSPRVQARTMLEGIRRGEETEPGAESSHVKAEIYAIAAYFIEKATASALAWLQANPGKGMQQQIIAIDGAMMQSSVVTIDDVSAFLSSTDKDEVLQRISELIEGLLHYHVKQVMNPDVPAPLVNPADEHIQERMRSLLGEPSFRGGQDFAARDFVLNATRAPAVFIPVSYHAGLTAFSEAFGRLPEPTEELDLFAKRISPILLRLAQFNVDDVASFIQEHFGDRAVRTDLPLAAFDTHVTLVRSDNHNYQFSFPEVETYQESADISESTVGCPALYARPGSQNVIRVMVTYATELLKQSGLYVKPTK